MLPLSALLKLREALSTPTSSSEGEPVAWIFTDTNGSTYCASAKAPLHCALYEDRGYRKEALYAQPTVSLDSEAVAAWMYETYDRVDGKLCRFSLCQMSAEERVGGGWIETPLYAQPAHARSSVDAKGYATELREIAGMLAQQPDGPVRWKQYRLVAIADYLAALQPTNAGDVG